MSSLHYEDGGLRVFHGDNRDVLPTFPDASFDSIVTDPPYELGFMGKGWDSTGIAYDVDLWREAYRVLKPGGHLLAFGGTRTWHRIAAAIEDAGFQIRDSIAWMYGSGFPKSMNVSKAIDATLMHGGSNSRRIREANASRPGDGRVGAALPQNGIMGAPAEARVTNDEPATDEGREWNGWGTALKPAFEPIVVARKPFAATVAANVLAYGTGALNIEATRTPAADSQLAEKYASVQNAGARQNAVYGADERTREGSAPHEAGRWPTNVLLDSTQAEALDVQTGVSRSRIGKPRGAAAGDGWGMTKTGAEYDDEGGASRFFPTFRYEAKAPGSERPTVDGVAHATVKPLDLMRWLVRLVTRRGGHVLDLFAGSGTTGEAALLEGMECTLIEYEAAHLPLILARVRKPLQPSMFGDWGGEAS